MQVEGKMAGEFDFERYWLGKLSACLDKVVGEKIRAEIMAGSEALSAASSREEVIVWTRSAMERLDARLDESQRRRVLTGCACQYPKADLQEVRQRYQATGDVDLALGMLQDRFESFLTDTLELDGELIEEVVGRGWGLAGVRVGDTIVATKIPKSGFLVEYMNETDPERKRQYYCHCPRIRDLLKSGDSLSPTYCYCGAGYYKGIWEEILQQPVEVEVLESVLQGDEVCRIAVHLPQRR
jgi:hypothetical protein